jgi:hypothetical protein
VTLLGAHHILHVSRIGVKRRIHGAGVREWGTEEDIWAGEDKVTGVQKTA